jgi:hypothetical protein
MGWLLTTLAWVAVVWFVGQAVVYWSAIGRSTSAVNKWLHALSGLRVHRRRLARVDEVELVWDWAGGGYFGWDHDSDDACGTLPANPLAQEFSARRGRLYARSVGQ